MTTALEVLYGLVLPDGRRWREGADPDRLSDAQAFLAPPGGHPRRYLNLRSRGRAKTLDAAGYAIAAMLTAPPGARLFAAAGDKDQAALLRDAAVGLIQRTPEITPAFSASQHEIRVPRSDVVLTVIAADAVTSWGLTPYMIVVDEWCQWPSSENPKKLWESLTTAIPKRPDSRLLVISTAGTPGSWQHLEFLAMLDDPAWRVSSLDGPAPWIDPAEIEVERRRLLPSAFARWWLNQWVDAEDRLAAGEDIDACATLAGDLGPQPNTRYVVGVDLAVKNDNVAIVVGHKADGVVFADRVAVFSPPKKGEVDLADVEAFIAELAREFGRSRTTVMFDPYQAIGMRQRLTGRGVRCEDASMTAQGNNKRTLMLYRAFKDHGLRLPRQGSSMAADVLLDEARHLRLVETSPGVFRQDHQQGRHDDTMTALSLVVEFLAGDTSQPVRTDVGPGSVTKSAGACPISGDYSKPDYQPSIGPPKHNDFPGPWAGR